MNPRGTRAINSDFCVRWRPHLEQLADRMRNAARSALDEALCEVDRGSFTRPTGRGVGDWTFALDEGPEEVLTAWLDERAREGPISLLTEDAGWRHRGPGETADSASIEIPAFDHGGPRIAVDPVDGTRNLMFNLRPAWSVLSVAGPGESEPRFADLVAGMISEIPTAGASSYRRIWAELGAGCTSQRLGLDGESRADCDTLEVDGDGRPDHGYFSFFTYDSRARPAIATLAADFFGRLERHEGASRDHCYDDQYISSGGQLALLALGSYRFVADLRGRSQGWLERKTQTAKPYDMAGAALCALEAGAVVLNLDGTPLDIPIDACTPVDFIAFANAATHARLMPHFHDSLQRMDEAFKAGDPALDILRDRAR